MSVPKRKRKRTGGERCALATGSVSQGVADVLDAWDRGGNYRDLAPAIAALRKLRTTEHVSMMVLEYEPALTHSVWKDCYYDDAFTDEEIVADLRARVKKGEIVGWRLITIHKDVLGVDAPNEKLSHGGGNEQ